ncbi:MAG: metallophosphoesterase [Planctomycetaceae bacterium]|nr:metallophosphoesterase [Planctomycetaceae bacterium]
MKAARYLAFITVTAILAAPCIAAARGHSSKHAASQPATQAPPLTPLTTPWLQGVTTNSIYVLYEAPDKTPAADVDYGLTDKYGSTASAESTQATGEGKGAVHNVKLSALTPNTLYHYRVRWKETTTADYTFRTAPLPGTPARWVVTGDMHYNPDPKVHDGVLKAIEAVQPGMAATTGDLITAGTGYGEWRQGWFTPGQCKIMTTMPWIEAIGNHEYQEPSHSRGRAFRAWVFEQAPDGVDDGYFSFDYGDAHIVVLMYNMAIPFGPNDPQWKWIKEDLAATKQKWKFLLMHHPAYSYGGHNGNKPRIRLTSEVLEPAGVDFVITGHQHFYQNVQVNGIYHIVTNCSGGMRPPQGVPSGQPGKITAMERAYSFVQIDTTPDKVVVTARRIDGSVIETITKTKNGVSSTTKPAPAAAMAK